MNMLKQGSKGVDVAQLQQLLNCTMSTNYHSLKVDGIFGPLTNRRLIDFQRLAHLATDGVAGPRTMAALSINLKDFVNHAASLRAALNDVGMPSDCIARFDAADSATRQLFAKSRN